MNAEAIKAQHSGTKNAGKALIFYADGKELAPDVDTLDATNIDQRLIQVADQIVQQIISGHRVNPAIVGISIPGKLGYSNELLQSWEIFNTMVIKPERKLILDTFKEVLIYNGVTTANIQELVPIKIVQ
jgi:predicted  nucleic acid-binding Zn ribbon protein